MPSLVEGYRDIHRKLKLNIFVSRRYMNKRGNGNGCSKKMCSSAIVYTVQELQILLINFEQILTFY